MVSTRLVAAVLASFAGCLTAAAEPYIPKSATVVLEVLPEFRDPAGRALRDQHQALTRDPKNLPLALQVARADIERGRADGDPRYFGRAQAALAPWYTAPADTIPPEVLLLRATLLQSAHDFAGAMADLDALVRRQPRNGQAWLTRAVIDGVEANYPAALLDCGQLANLSDTLAPAICTASVASLTGHARQALAAMRVYYDEFTGEQVSVKLWALTIMAETAARLGDAETAEVDFRNALELGPSDAYLLGAYSDFLLDRQRPKEVVRLLADRVRIDPLLLRLAIAEKTLNDPVATTHIADLADRFAASRLRGENIHRREEARFTLALLDRPADALALAAANWQVQREPADARILLEAALAADDEAAAKPAIGWFEGNAVEDPRLGGLIQKIAGKSQKPAG